MAQHSGAKVRQTAIGVLGYPPDAFGIHYDDFRILSEALTNSNHSEN